MPGRKIKITDEQRRLLSAAGYTPVEMQVAGVKKVTLYKQSGGEWQPHPNLLPFLQLLNTLTTWSAIQVLRCRSLLIPLKASRKLRHQAQSRWESSLAMCVATKPRRLRQ
jgi:hypothetical protein